MKNLRSYPVSMKMATDGRSTVQSWLGKQLEMHGIDAVIYTRYILSILQQEAVELCCDSPLLFKSKSNKGSPRCPSKWWDQEAADKVKKLTAVQCLKSVSEDSTDFEPLIDELYDKLHGDCARQEVEEVKPVPSDNTDSDTSIEEAAERYYAAFPLLTCSSTVKFTSGYQEGVNESLGGFENSKKVDCGSQKIYDISGETVYQKITKEGALEEEESSSQMKCEVFHAVVPFEPISPSNNNDQIEQELEALVNQHLHAKSWKDLDQYHPTGLLHSTHVQGAVYYGREARCTSTPKKLFELQSPGKLQQSASSARKKLVFVSEYVDVDNDSLWLKSPSLEEDQLWYTQPFDDIPAFSSSQRLYHRQDMTCNCGDSVITNSVSSETPGKQPQSRLSSLYRLAFQPTSSENDVPDDRPTSQSILASENFTNVDIYDQLGEMLRAASVNSEADNVTYDGIFDVLSTERLSDSPIKRCGILQGLISCHQDISLDKYSLDLGTQLFQRKSPGQAAWGYHNLFLSYEQAINDHGDFDSFNAPGSFNPWNSVKDIHEKKFLALKKSGGKESTDNTFLGHDWKLSTFVAPISMDKTSPSWSVVTINPPSGPSFLKSAPGSAFKPVDNANFRPSGSIHVNIEPKVVKNRFVIKPEVMSHGQIGHGSFHDNIEELELAPQAHFRPINESLLEADNSPCISGAVNCFSVVIPTPTRQTSDMMYGRISAYQVYKEEEEDEGIEEPKIFVPRFRINHNLEKGVQTDELMGHLDRLASDVADLLDLDTSECEDCLQYQLEDSSDQGPEITSWSSHFSASSYLDDSVFLPRESSYESMCSCKRVDCPCINDIGQNVWKFWAPQQEYGSQSELNHEQGSPVDANVLVSNDAIWSNKDGVGFFFLSDILHQSEQALTEEFTEKMIPGNRRVASLEKIWLDGEDITFRETDEKEDVAFMEDTLNTFNRVKWSIGDEPIVVEDYVIKPQEIQQAYYSCDLEEEWLKNSQPIGALKTRKPCSFFLERECHHSDCKYSHDVSFITCQFWEEGDCIKGEYCPFLHGYIKDCQHKEKPSNFSHFNNKKTMPVKSRRNNNHTYKSTLVKSKSRKRSKSLCVNEVSKI